MEVICDFETCNPRLDLTECGSRVYAEHWATEILCCAYDSPAYQGLWKPGAKGWGLRTLAEYADTFICHGTFEIDIWRELMVPVYGFPEIPIERWHDIQASAGYRQVPLKLERLLPALGLPYDKDKVGSKLTISLSRPDTRKGPKKNPNPNYGRLPIRTPEIMQRVYAYCADDVQNEVAAHRRLGFLPDAERRVWELDQRINDRGVALDREFIVGARRIVDDARAPLVAEFTELTGLEPTQTKAFLGWLQGNGVAIGNVQKGTIADLLGEREEDDEDGELVSAPQGAGAASLPGNVRRALAIRALVGSSSISKLSRMEAAIARDGRAHRVSAYHGTGPGRWAGRLFNPLNFPRGLIRDRPGGKPPDPEFLATVISTGDVDAVEILGAVVEDNASYRAANPIEVVASSLRHALVAAQGRRLVVGDFAGIQARLVLAMAGQHDKTELLSSGADVYLDMAEDIYGVPKGSLDKHRDVEKRQVGKNTVLGCGFQMGWQKFHDKYCPDQPPEFAQQVIGAYREKWAPCVPKLWADLADAALRTVYDGTPHEAAGIEYRLEDGWLSARLYNGKKIWYWNPRRSSRAEQQADFNARGADPTKANTTVAWDKECWKYQATKQGQVKWVYAFGGLLTENVVMGHERELLVRAMFKCEEENLPVIFNSYDEIVCEVDEAHASWPVLKQIMEDVPDWAKQIKLPVAAEGWTGTRYKKG